MKKLSYAVKIDARKRIPSTQLKLEMEKKKRKNKNGKKEKELFSILDKFKLKNH